MIGGVALPDADEVLEGFQHGRDGHIGPDGVVLVLAVPARVRAVHVEEVGVLGHHAVVLPLPQVARLVHVLHEGFEGCFLMSNGD